MSSITKESRTIKLKKSKNSDCFNRSKPWSLIIVCADMLLTRLWSTSCFSRTYLKSVSAHLKPFNTSFKEQEQCWLSKVILRFCYQVLCCLYPCLDIWPIQGKEWTDYGVIPQESQPANVSMVKGMKYRADSAIHVSYSTTVMN